MLLSLDKISNEIQKNPALKTGCVVDTNLLFAAWYTADEFNEWAEHVFNFLHEEEIPIFTNLNVRAEFMDLNRRVMIPEGLITMYDDLSGSLTAEIEAKLKSLKTTVKNTTEKDRVYKASDKQIKDLRALLKGFSHPTLGSDAWTLFCRDYFQPYIKVVWKQVVETLKVQFLGTREIDEGKYFTDRPTWSDATDIMAKTGIGSADAMIVNLFEKSTLLIMITADKDVRDAVLSSSRGRYVVAPH